MIAQHPFWFSLVLACVLWYSTIMVYVAIRGAADIKAMLRKLSAPSEEAEGPDPPQAARQ